MYLASKYTVALSSVAIFAGLYFVLAPPVSFFYHERQLAIVPENYVFQAAKPNIWADLNDAEFEDVLEYLYTRPDGLNLTRKALATAWDNQIVLVQALLPNKTNTLPYLDGNSEPPARWARVLVNQAASEEPALYDYMVGPLPASKVTQILPLDFCYNSGRNYVWSPLRDMQNLMEWIDTKAQEFSDITLDLLGSVPNHLNQSNAEGLGIGGRIVKMEAGRIIFWIQFYREGRKSDAKSILPQGLYAKLDAPTKDSRNWRIVQWFYNGILYNSTEMFRAAWKSPGFERAPPNLDGDWTDVEDYDHRPPGRDKPPPVMIQPSGSRYDIDRKQRFVSWMGFEFYVAFSPITGLSLFDIKFRNERIIYELGMQEALVHYTGDDPTQGGQYFLDTLAAMGMRMFELTPGYDCPVYATYLSTSYYVGDSTLRNKNNICIFEYTADHPLQRHTTATSVSISRSQYLILRSVSTVGNYDYTIDYLFYLDGSIEVKVRASGFIIGAFYASSKDGKQTKQNEYGYRIHDAVSSSVHDHVINFKADLDVAGTTNTLVRVGIEPISVPYPWEEAEHTQSNTMHLTQKPIYEEIGLDWPRNSGEMYIILNNDSTNAWGEKRGYRIGPGTGMGTPSHLTALNSTSLGKTAQWATRDLWVVKQKDTEPWSASLMNRLEPANPLVEFGKFVDGERTVQEDLVIYFNLGTHHVPTSGDIPNTLMHTSASSVMFTPHNFHDRDPSRESVQGVKLELGADSHKARYFGGRYMEGVMLKSTDLEPDLSRYQATMHHVTDLSLNKSLMGA